MIDILNWLGNFVGNTFNRLFSFRISGNISLGSTFVYFAIVGIAISFIRRLINRAT